MHLYTILIWLGRLFIMLKYFPIESKGRQQKLREVGRVASICFCCFSARCIMVRIFVHWTLCRFSTQNSFMKFALYLLCRCASMHLMKKLTSMFLTIQFWISSITWYVWLLQKHEIMCSVPVWPLQIDAYCNSMFHCSLSKFFLLLLSCTFWGGFLQNYGYHSITPSAAARDEALPSSELKMVNTVWVMQNQLQRPLYSICIGSNPKFFCSSPIANPISSMYWFYEI